MIHITRFLLFAALILLSWLPAAHLAAQNLEWHLFSPPDGTDPTIHCMTADPAGNLYSAGYSGPTTDMDPGPAVVPGPPGNTYVRKLDAGRTYQWSVAFEVLDAYCIPQDMCIDGLGNIIVSGKFQGTVDFDPSPAQALHSATTGSDCFVCKLDPSGNFLWVNTLGNVTAAWASRVTVDPANNVWVGGLLQEAADFDPGPGELTLGPNGGYLWKLDPDGNYSWAGLIGGPGSGFTTITDLVTDANGILHAAGWYDGDVDLGPGAGSHPSTIANGRFVLKLQANGDLDWAAELPDEFGLYLALDGEGDLIVSGAFMPGPDDDPYDFDPGPGSYELLTGGSPFAWKLSPQGELIWVRVFGDNGQVTEEVWPATDAENHVIVTGKGLSGTDLDPGPGSVLPPVGQSYTYVSVLDAQGDFVWGGFITNDYDVYDLTRLYTFAPVTDAAGDIYMGGLAWGTIDLDPGPGNITIVADDVDQFENQIQSTFVVKLSPVSTAIAQADMHDIGIYPVPVQDQLRISAREPLQQLRLLDMSGRAVRTYPPTARVLDVHDLSTGTYLLDVVTSSGHTIRTVMKQ